MKNALLSSILVLLMIFGSKNSYTQTREPAAENQEIAEFDPSRAFLVFHPKDKNEIVSNTVRSRNSTFSETFNKLSFEMSSHKKVNHYEEYSDIVISKTVDNNFPNEGDTIEFTISITNYGPAPLTNLTVTDTLAQGLVLTDTVYSNGTWDSPVWTLNKLNVGNSDTLILFAKVDQSTAGDTIHNFVYHFQDQTDVNLIPDDMSETIIVNVLPQAVDDQTNVDEDDVLFDDVLINDSGLDNGGIYVTVISGVSNGALEMNTNGTYTYTPLPDYHGNDGFRYEVCDIHTDCDQADVSIIVNSVNDFPSVQDDFFTINEDSEGNVMYVLLDNGNGEDTFGGDGYGNQPIIQMIGPDNGSLEFSDNETPTVMTDDYFIYTPNRNYFGSDSFEYELCDENNDCVQALVSIEIINDDIIFVPDIFSPNQDGFNDYFMIEGLEFYPKNSIVIFNRWGNKVFEANPYNNDWNGTNSFGISGGGNELPEGTYFYILKTNDNQEDLRGSVYLKR